MPTSIHSGSAGTSRRTGATSLSTRSCLARANLPAAILCLCAILLVGCGDGCGAGCDRAPDADSWTTRQQASYAFGFEWALHHGYGMDDLDFDLVAAGMRDAVQDAAGARLDETTRLEALESLDCRRSEDRAAAARERAMEERRRGEAFLRVNRGRPDVRVTDSGLQYTILEEGTGAVPDNGDVVRVHYRGVLLDGLEFDSTHARGAPVDLPLRHAIPGWREGLRQMREGAKGRIWIPADLAHGDEGDGRRIPGGALLIYDIELLEIFPKPDLEQP